MTTKKTVDVKYTDDEIKHIKVLKAYNDDFDNSIIMTSQDVEKYEKYISDLETDISNLANTNFKLFDKLANANAKNVNCKIALFDQEQQMKDAQNDEDLVKIEIAKKNEKESEVVSKDFQDIVNQNVKEIEIKEKKVKVAKDILRKLQFSIKMAEAEKAENEKIIDEITANAIKRQTEK